LVHDIYYSWYFQPRRHLDVKGNTLSEILKVSKRLARECSKLDVCYRDLEAVQLYAKKSRIQRSAEMIIDLYKTFGERPEVFAMSDIEIAKLKKYLADPSGNVNRSEAVMYFDYIKMAKDLGYDMKSSMVRYPYDLRKAHDDAVEDLDARKNEVIYSKLNTLLPGLHKSFDFSDNALLIKAPDKAHDIVREGQSLHHCVKTYIKAMSDGECVILFVRRKEEPDKPYVTVEIRNGRIAQCRGFANKDPEKEVWDFMEKFKKQRLAA